MNLDMLKEYEVLKNEELPDLNSEGVLLRHKKSGARIVLLSNDDDNKVFYIGFRTTPDNSTGVAHIMEHSVLCGSRKFPVKDPFVELVKGSLNTFLNAMTYPDKTLYPVASCNDKDFQNLMDVYLDAVFYPNIYKESKIFKQEGWHYEIGDAADPVKINGVVYNEMKGAFSSPDDVLDRAILNSLFPDNTYANESGGDPDDIPNLTYEEFIAFHQKYYHPSNSYIYLYGDMDMKEKLRWLDKEYLSAFDDQKVDSAIAEQKAFDKPLDIVREYSITEQESAEHNTYLSYNAVIGNVLDAERYIAFQILDYALCSAPGAPVKKALLQKGIGTESYGGFDNGVYQPYFSIVSKNAELSQKQEFLDIIEAELKKAVEQGIDKNALKAALNLFEFRYREADFGSYPKGLMYGLQMLDSWIYDENEPFLHIEAGDTYRILKEKIDTDYYEKLVKDYLLDNPHKAYVCVVPHKGLNTLKEKELAKKLADYKASLSEKEVEELVRQTKELAEYQESEDSKENLKKIPMLGRNDLKKEAEPFVNELLKAGATDVLFHDIFTNGVSYTRLIFNIDGISEDELFVLGVLKLVVGMMDTKRHDYGAYFNEVFMKTGGIVPCINIYGNSKDSDKFRLHFECKAKTLYGETKEAFELIEEMLFETIFTDKKRLLEILEETKSKKEAQFMSSGHVTAQLRANSYYDKLAYIEEALGGIAFYQNLCRFIRDFDAESDAFIEKLQLMLHKICRPENFMVDYTGTKEGLFEVLDRIPAFTKKLYTDPVEKHTLQISLSKKNEGFKTSGSVQFVCRSGNYKKKGLSYTGSLAVLRVMMGYDYLWLNVRVKGGAYGCMSAFRRTGECSFVSYRDPNLKETVDIYENAADYIRNYKADEDTMTKYVIGAVSDKDTPLTPQAKGLRSMTAYFSEWSLEDEQKERDELLNTGVKEINALGDHIAAFMDEHAFCVIGAEEKMKDNQDLFDGLYNLVEG